MAAVKAAAEAATAKAAKAAAAKAEASNPLAHLPAAFLSDAVAAAPDLIGSQLAEGEGEDLRRKIAEDAERMRLELLRRIGADVKQEPVKEEQTAIKQEPAEEEKKEDKKAE